MQAAARYYHARDYVEAERCCRELLARDAAHFDALHLLGVIHFDRSQLTEAVEYLTGAVALHPADPLVNYHLGMRWPNRRFAAPQQVIQTTPAC
jgi:predicted Zn-dependent protease